MLIKQVPRAPQRLRISSQGFLDLLARLVMTLGPQPCHQSNGHVEKRWGINFSLWGARGTCFISIFGFQLLVIFLTFFKSVFKVFSRCFQGVFNVFSRRFQCVFNVFSRCFQGVFKVFSKRFQSVFKAFSRRFQGVFKVFLQTPKSPTQAVFKLFW